uniref:Adenylyl cyclase-associated protein n=1 Tax=Leptobrachium leishanense TaxID=445787 RepID=A0A8C5PY56_9ANUR
VADMQNLVSRLEKAVEKLESLAIGSGGTSGSGDTAKFVVAFDALVDGPVAEFAKYSNEVGGDVEMVLTGIQLQRQIIVTASQCQQPAEKDLVALLAPLSNQILAVQNFREKNRGSKLFNHLSAVSESIPALGWVAVGPGPPPPPPPGCPPPPPPQSAPAEYDDTVSRSKLFAELNQGAIITKGLKHVSDDQKTHKNPQVKKLTGPKPFASPKPTIHSPAAKPVAKKEPPVLELEGKKWRVENQENQVVYIYKCVNSTLQVKEKINSITVDNCTKLGLVFEDAVGIVEVINSRDVKLQVLGKVPTISINKTDGCHVYLSKGSLTCEIVSAKSSEMNILVPGKDGDFSEFPVPEQFKTVYNGQKLVTTVTEIAG